MKRDYSPVTSCDDTLSEPRSLAHKASSGLADKEGFRSFVFQVLSQRYYTNPLIFLVF